MSCWVTHGDDPMDCDYEAKEEGMESKKKAPPRQLPEPSCIPSPLGSEEDDNDGDEERGGGDKDEESANEGLEYSPRLVVSPIDMSSTPSRRKKWNEDRFQSYHHACDLKHFGQRASSPCPCFHTQAQYDLFWGRFEQAPM